VRRLIIAQFITDGGVRKIDVKHEAVINANVNVEDIVTPQKSVVKIPYTAQAAGGDIAIIKNGAQTEFVGVVDAVKNDTATEISLYPVSQLFNIEVPIPAMSGGVYDYIAALFNTNFVSVADTLAKIPLTVSNGIIDSTGLTAVDMTFDSAAKIYDTLYTIFLATGVYCDYGIAYDASGIPTGIAVTVKRNTDGAERVIRHNNPAIVKGGIVRNFTQAQNVNKLVLLDEGTSARYEYYLKKDNTITTSASDAQRFEVVRQKVRYIATGSTSAERDAVAAQELKGEAYSHSITVSMLKSYYDDYKVHERVLFYDHDGTQYHSIITKIEKTDAHITLTLGLVRTKLTDKFAKQVAAGGGASGGGTPGPAGPQGQSPYIGANGNWYVGDTDLGVHAQGDTGAPGQAGTSPHIGANGNWFVGIVDTGIHAQGEAGADGRGIASTETTYQLHTNGTTAPTGTWLSDPLEETEEMPFLWTRIVHTYTSGSPTTAYSISKIGDKGNQGYPGTQATTGSDVGLKVIQFVAADWALDGSLYALTKTHAQHKMGESSSLQVNVRQSLADGKMADVGVASEVQSDGTILVYSDTAFDGALYIMGGVAQGVDLEARATLLTKVGTDDPRLTDSRPASDVYPWAKGPTKPSYSAAEVSAVALGDAIMNTNPFGVKKLYINSLYNAAFLLPLRFPVTATTYNPDGTVYAVLNEGERIRLFNGKYEQFVIIPQGKHLVIQIDFQGFIDDYQYGSIYLSHYYDRHQKSSKLRVYSLYEPHGIGWHETDFTPYIQNPEAQIMVARQEWHFISQMEIIVYAKDDADTWLTKIDYALDRPTRAEMPFLDKFAANRLYWELDTTNGAIIKELGQRVYSPNNKPSSGDIGAAPAFHVHENAVAGGAAGFMSGADKTKLDTLGGSGYSRYVKPFVAGDWAGSAGAYTMTIAAAVHGFGVTLPQISIYENGELNICGFDRSDNDWIISSDTVFAGTLIAL
jgi:hypothetical protein